MSRTVNEWIGATDSTPAPSRVRLRVFENDTGRCRACSRLITPGMQWQTDHVVALINGGQNRETNLQTLCMLCHAYKTGQDVAEKSDVARIRAKHLGLRKPKRPMVGSRASGWKRTFNNGWVRR